jgi:acetolactate synthase-1/2/3 large subunit
MTGADLLCDTLLVNGIDVCFANPGTSEMAFVAALDRKPQMRCILGLFEGVVTGAADGYGRMTGRPAATLLHTGPGLANGLANLHNAKRARTPVVNIVGDHASYHLKYNAPLTSDIESLARPMSDWVRRASGPADVGETAEATIVAARTTPGVATMILPADAAWSETGPVPPRKIDVPAMRLVEDRQVAAVAEKMRAHRGRIGIVLGGEAAWAGGIEIAARVAASAGARLFSEVLPARVSRGRHVPNVERIPYPPEMARAVLKDIDLLVLCGTEEPVAFFAYPGKPSRIAPEHCEVVTLAAKRDDKLQALQALEDLVGGTNTNASKRETAPFEGMPSGALTEDAIAVVLAQLMPENTVLAEEALTSAQRLYSLGASSASHDYMMVTGGSIGIGPPLATGAAIACPDRRVINLQADGSGMYTLQALWTQARERLDVLTIVCSNRAYAILKREMANLGVNDIGRNASRMIDIDDPPLDWVSLARGMGVEGARADSCERFVDLVRSGLSRKGPFLIEAVL